MKTFYAHQHFGQKVTPIAEGQGVVANAEYDEKTNLTFVHVAGSQIKHADATDQYKAVLIETAGIPAEGRGDGDNE